MLNGNALGALSDQASEPPNVIIVELVQQWQPGELDARHERQQDSGVLSRRWDSRLAEQTSCLGQQQPDRLAHPAGTPA